MPDDQNSGSTLTLDPEEVESTPEAKALDASEVEEAPSYPAAAAEDHASMPAGAVGPLPGVPQPRVDMRVPSIGQTLTGEDSRAPLSSASVYNYGQNAIPRAAQGAREVRQGQYVKGATDVLGGLNDAMGSQVLPLGSAPAAVVKGVAGSMAGATAAPYVAKKLGASPDVQALAGEVGAVCRWRPALVLI